MSVYVATRDVVSVAGADASSYLQGQISQDVDALSVGDSAWSLILQPQGKVDAWFRITRTGDERFLLDVEPGYGPSLLARIERFLLRVAVDVDLATWDHHRYPSNPPEVDAPIVAPALWGGGVDVIGADLERPPGPYATFDEYERGRLHAGIPAMGAELDESTIPAEAGIVDLSVSFTKGCYTGQELVARVDSRGGNTPRRLRILSGSGPAPAPGSALRDGDSEVGLLTSAVADSAPDTWVGLGYIRRAGLDLDLVLTEAGVAASVRRPPGER